VVWSVVTAPPPLHEPTHLLDDGTVTVDGATPANPRALAAGRGLDPNVYALGRALHSEQAGGARIAREGIAWAMVNQARHVGRSVLDLVTRAGRKVGGAWVPHPTGNGHFGRQNQGRYVATSRDADAEAYEIAAGVLAGTIDDPTGGARQFDDVSAFGAQAGTTAADADRVAADRIAAGNELVQLPGAPDLRFWRPT
jgi:hypothetical protein